MVAVSARGKNLLIGFSNGLTLHTHLMMNGAWHLYALGERWRMPADTLQAFIAQYIAPQPPHVDEITFAWQGGEPTLLGLEFFEHAIELQRRHAPRGKRIVNTL